MSLLPTPPFLISPKSTENHRSPKFLTTRFSNTSNVPDLATSINGSEFIRQAQRQSASSHLQKRICITYLSKRALTDLIPRSMPSQGHTTTMMNQYTRSWHVLFGMDDVKVEGVKEIVVISNNTEEIPDHEIMISQNGDNEEEVNSPAVFPRPRVRRKLFPESLEANDRESSTKPGIYFIDLTSDGQLRTRVEKGRDLPKPPLLAKDGAGVSTFSPLPSSCASNSPFGWNLDVRK
ncbi:hypothetical protein SASPL_130402 [Salvia splendens]|uniref:Uncharacterized protein n=1 Tax=Salvia splendens TaxID=180675 RepID=A0A8X8ZJW0_SALSN|nr:hypothetical protein SASPL_130402 [Salvia splendens]